MMSPAQYEITKQQATMFEKALRDMDGQPAAPEGIHPMLWKAQRDGLQSQLNDLHDQIRKYESQAQ